MKALIVAAAMLTLLAPQASDAQRAPQRTAPAKPAARVPADPIFPEPDFQAAFKETLFCGGKSKEPAPENCASTWRDISWSMTNGRIGEIKPAVGSPWLFECNYDAVEDEERCFFRTGDAFAVILSGNRALVTWGYNRFPGSELVARFDDDAPLRTAAQDGWTWGQSEALMRKMLYKKALRYRWSDWPENSNHDGSINLDRFADVASLMKAISYTFSAIQSDRRSAAGD